MKLRSRGITQESIQYLIVVSIFQFFEHLSGVLLFMAHSEKLIVQPALKLESKLLAKNLPFCIGQLFLRDKYRLSLLSA
jgi:hypothetical protein